MYQVREPYSTVQYLAERIDIASLLGLPHRSSPDVVDDNLLCQFWAKFGRFGQKILFLLEKSKVLLPT